MDDKVSGPRPSLLGELEALRQTVKRLKDTAQKASEQSLRDQAAFAALMARGPPPCP
jgi:hypothetical protein